MVGRRRQDAPASGSGESKGASPGSGLPAAERLSRRHRATLEAVCANPVRGDVPWRDIESLLVALGAVTTEGRGSRVRFLLNGRVGLFHRPHPQKETDQGAIKSVRRYLKESGVIP